MLAEHVLKCFRALYDCLGARELVRIAHALAPLSQPVQCVVSRFLVESAHIPAQPVELALRKLLERDLAGGRLERRDQFFETIQ